MSGSPDTCVTTVVGAAVQLGAVVAILLLNIEADIGVAAMDTVGRAQVGAG